MGSTAPAGYLICDGSAVSRTAYDKLFQAIGTKYGEGDGSTTFNLPNLIGKFLQGDVTSGTIKEAGLPNITGSFDNSIGNYVAQWGGGVGALFNEGEQTCYDPAQGSGNHIKARRFSFDASRSNSIYGNSDTVQPPSVTSIPCIKAFDSVIDATTVSVAQLSDTKVNKAGDTMTGSLTAPSFIANGIDCSVDSQGDGWLRYSSGIQICWGVLNFGRVEPSPPNNHMSTDKQLSYNVFKDTPTLSLTRSRSSGGWPQLQCEATFTTSTYANIKVYNNNLQGSWGETSYMWIAIGRWK